MEEEDDDIYGSPPPEHEHNEPRQPATASTTTIKQEHDGSEQEEGEESEDDSDSDIDIITERDPGASTNLETQASRPESKANVKPSTSEQPADRDEGTSVARGKQSRPTANSKPGHEYPEVHVSKIETDKNPEYEPMGKPIMELDFDADLAEHDKPWRRPGAEQSDYFNYGFDEFTWATYCMKQKSMRGAINEQKAESKQFEFMFGGQAGIGGGPPGAPTGPSQNNGMPQMNGMPGMPELSPDMMNAMMQHMMATGVDPSQVGPMDLANMMQQIQGGMQGNQAYGGGPGMIEQGHMQQNQGYSGSGRGRGRRGRW